MEKPAKLLIAAQFYPPDTSTTAAYVGRIANTLAADHQVTVISATPGSGEIDPPGKPGVVEISTWNPGGSALVRRSLAICLLAVRMFFAVLRRAGPKDTVFCVTTPFTLPYAVLLAAKLKGAATVLLIYDLYPEILEAAGIAQSSSFPVRLIHAANTQLFRRLDAIVVIGRDVPPLIQKYRGVEAGKIHYIPNWPLIPIGYRQTDPTSRFRSPDASRLIVGLSGNLGFTHDPATVFHAARLLRNDDNIHFILSGWGVGWKELNDLFAKDRLENVTILRPVAENELVEFLSAADLWIIPYRRNVAGASIPSRLYNILAVGRPVIVACEPNSEGALVLNEEAIGWVVPPENPAELARTIREAARDRQSTTDKGLRAADVAWKYSEEIALARYRRVVNSVRRA
ncbi:glycosyltransferase family 4 protein [Bradyrhizobium sp. WYCCWR 12699]|uniref:glycosyltransferase family 4 protein n=1 Tax=Bradyrhizobium sp. WYCCWR 12699 TaxID=3064203 RepID=UPI0028A49C37|nr:glycosyltransferase family 4 protein [Bradyrhizobium sp. WYCCWR 12699]MDT4740716.1 glycosyltransferase family 4 protein [Bradyrhizobium sp. WYCCWR 12699]